ncbi:hypothetical protein, partial [Dialister invisus]
KEEESNRKKNYAASRFSPDEIGTYGKKIKAVSCKLTILLRFKSLRQASILNRTACASSSF